LSALFGLPMDAEAREIYRKHTGREDVPAAQFREAFLVCGRRSGKSIIASLIAVFVACLRDYDSVLAPGEMGVVMILAADRRQAQTIFRYTAALLEAPLLRTLVVAKRKESIDLRNRVRIEVHTSNYKAVRGVTLICAVCDELAFWQSEDSANPDVEVVGALIPAMATIPNALLLGISSPYARRGQLYNEYKQHFGKHSDTLVWQADSRSMNPTLPAEVVEKAYAKDASSASAEYGGQFRTDVENFLSVETVEARIISGRHELPYDASKTYYGFADPSGGVSDSYCMAIAHVEGEKATLDLLREAQAPLSPKAVTQEFAAIFKAYHVSEIEGDRYAGEWPREEFQKWGVNYRVAEKTKNELYLELLPALMSAQCELLDHPRLLAQLCGLERRTGRLHDAIDHPPNTHDDCANCVAGVLAQVLAWNVTGQLGVLDWIKRKAKEIAEGTRDRFGELVHKKPEPKAPLIVVPARRSPEQVRIDNFQEWLRTHKAPPCAACGSAATTYNEQRKIRCNQCRSVDGVAPPPPAGSCCGDYLPQVVGGGGFRCQNCGTQTNQAVVVAGWKRADIVRARSSFGRFSSR
jgi:hypothetical protein